MRSLLVALFAVLSLSACATVPLDYATLPVDGPYGHNLTRFAAISTPPERQDALPRCSNAQGHIRRTHDEAKCQFVDVLRDIAASVEAPKGAIDKADQTLPADADTARRFADEVAKCRAQPVFCIAQVLAPEQKAGQTWKYDDWADAHAFTRYYTEAVTRFTVDECVIRTGAQNHTSSRANLVMAGIFAAVGLAGDVVAIDAARQAANKTYDSSVGTAAAAAAIASSTSNVQKIFPATAVLKVNDLVSAGQSYAPLIGFESSDVACTLPSDLRPPWIQPRSGACEQAYLKFARLHDAVMSACPAASY